MTIAPAVRPSDARGYAYLISIVAALSGLLFGFDTAVINGALPFLRDEFRLTDWEVELVAGVLLWGCAVGAAMAGVISDRFGRRKTLVFAAIVFALAAIGSAIPRGLTELALARFAGGLAVGVASVLAPMYIAEVSPPHVRGRLVSINQFAIVIGVLCAYIINWKLAGLGPGNWRWMFGVAAVPSLAFFVGLLFIPESPRWLVHKGFTTLARTVLTRISNPVEADQEMRAISKSLEEESTFSYRELLKPGIRRAVILGCTLMILTQVTGINTIIYYGSILLRDHAGQSATSAIGANVLIGTTNFFTTIMAMFTIDRLGRKPLLMFGSAGMCLALTALGFAFGMSPQPYTLIVSMILCYVGCFSLSLGCGGWVYLSELYPTAVRARAMSVGTLCVWLACLVVTLTFLTLIRLLGTSVVFWVYASLCAVTFFFVWLAMPETKGRTLEEIQGWWAPGGRYGK
ncbi:MAG: sugar porter family MFS transporter [Acidobacteria bacterium]|nr:sugar porter family MFS transporter [Acidobacteriota bacterium]